MRFVPFIPAFLFLSGCTTTKTVYVVVTPTPPSTASIQIPTPAPGALPSTSLSNSDNEEIKYIQQFSALNSKFGAVHTSIQVEFEKRPVQSANFTQYEPSVAQLRQEFQLLNPATPPGLFKAKLDLDMAISELNNSLQTMQRGIQNSDMELLRAGTKSFLSSADLNIASMEAGVAYARSKARR